MTISNQSQADQPPPLPPRRRLLKYTGVRKRSWGRWVAEIRVPRSRERLWLGSYSNPHQAARAYDVAASCLRGPAASLNLPHHALPQPAPCTSPSSIREFAAQEAARFSLLEENQVASPTLSIKNSYAGPMSSSMRQPGSNNLGFSVAPLELDKCDQQLGQPSLSCLAVNPLENHLSCVTEGLDNHWNSSTELQRFQDPNAPETNLHSRAAPPLSEPHNAQMQHQLDCEETYARNESPDGPQSLLDLWFCLDIGPAVHPSLKALLTHSLYPNSAKR